MSATPFTGAYLPELGSMDILPPPMLPVPESQIFDPARFTYPLHVCLMHSGGRLPIVVNMRAYFYTYSTACPLIKSSWRTAGLDPVPDSAPLILTSRFGLVLNSKNFWRFHATKDTCLAWYGASSIVTFVQLMAAKRATLSAHFHHLGVAATAAYFATQQDADTPQHPACEDFPWVGRWAALYEREAQGSLGRAWGTQDPRSYLRALVKGDDEERFEEDEEVAIEMYLDSGGGRIRRSEEYRAIRQSIRDSRAAMREEGNRELLVGDGHETREGGAAAKEEEGDRSDCDDDDFYGDDMKVEEG
ncbi:hypothetical protein P167DRAFT_546183 [Morchella conica CCBAS932]|uniref:Uncharacterized protein n=1 Tax=Morchella conica CCBAS932 TaxID=1392247 RepID=A0A3N4KTD4_9PEZI|nr:hypothetical protein P167DRAFT_546183 [Morchella conica CCBAS932]